MIQTQMINLVIGVVPRPSRITHATSDRVGACGTKLLNGLLKHQWQAGLQLPFRFAPTSPKRPNFASAQVSSVKGFANGVWFAPEELDMQAVDIERWLPFQFLTSLLRFGSGWFANQPLKSRGHSSWGRARAGVAE